MIGNTQGEEHLLQALAEPYLVLYHHLDAERQVNEAIQPEESSLAAFVSQIQHL